MKKLWQLKNKATWVLLTGILVLCTGFIFISCGVGPQLKARDSNAGQFAFDFNKCSGISCSLGFKMNSVIPDKYRIGNKEITLEVWIKPKSTSTSIVFSRNDGARGAKLTVEGIGGNTTQVTPKFTINRLVTDPITFATSTASYMVSGSNVLLNVWNHIAGFIVAADHSAVHPTVTCAGAEAQLPHLDIFVNGTISACATSRGVTNDTTIPLGYS
jgi:hypothetical protein